MIPAIKSAQIGTRKYQLFQALKVTFTADVITSTQNREMKKWGCRPGNLFYRKRFEVQQFQRKVPILWSNCKELQKKIRKWRCLCQNFRIIVFSWKCMQRERNVKLWEVLSRLQTAYSNLHVAYVVYNAQCNSNFRTGKQMPQTFLTHQKKILRREKQQLC